MLDLPHNSLKMGYLLPDIWWYFWRKKISVTDSDTRIDVRQRRIDLFGIEEFLLIYLILCYFARRYFSWKARKPCAKSFSDPQLKLEPTFHQRFQLTTVPLTIDNENILSPYGLELKSSNYLAQASPLQHSETPSKLVDQN